MAGSRLEKVGTIYTRVSGLIRSGAISWEDRPLWYDIYEAFPPKEEPKFDRPAPNMKLKNIFYKEDKIRALFHRNNKYLGSSNMFNNNYKSLTQKFIDIYQKLESSNPNATEEQLYKDAIETLKMDKEVKKQAEEEENLSLSTAFKQAQSVQIKEKLKLDVTNIFKDSVGFHISRRKYSKDSDINFAEIPVERIRNFSIIAHVDHGKSTLADRLLELTGTTKGGQNQILDKLQVERERGITVKAQSASLLYKYDGETYLLNLIDTPGHVDFSNEVHRSLSVCQGVILLVDSNDGVQAQTVANFYHAFINDLVIIPVLNKIDLKNANPERVCSQLKTLFDIIPEEVLKISAKLGTGIDDVLQRIVTKIPSPNVDRASKLKALLFDCTYDRYRGALSLVYVKDGSISLGDAISTYHIKKDYEVKSLSLLRPDEVPVKKLVAGQIGLLGCNMRSPKEAHIGDTIYHTNSTIEPLEGFKPTRPMVFAGIYPMDQSQNINLRSAIEKLTLNDSAVSIEVDTSPALGQGWRLGFLGLLHLEVFTQRLTQEYSAEPIITAPSVTYKIKLKPTKQNVKDGSDEIFINNPANFPEHMKIEQTFEPMIKATIITPDKYLGPIMSLCMERRGVQLNANNIDNERVILQYSLPLCEVVLDFHDTLKTISSGYASFDYENTGYEESNLVKLAILLNGTLVDELSSIVHVTKAKTMGRQMVLKLKDIIPRQLIHIAIQATVNGKIMARENIKAYRKDVTAKLYGGDVTRRMKLLAQQAAGKKKMRMVANISLPRETFIDVLKK